MPKPTLPPFWKWLMRGTFALTMVLFLTPAFYAVKYFAADKPAETAKVHASPSIPVSQIPLGAENLPLLEDRARHGAAVERIPAVRRMGETLRLPYVSVKRPLECLSAKAALADLATHAPDLEVRAAASEELGKVASGGGAVIRR